MTEPDPIPVRIVKDEKPSFSSMLMAGGCLLACGAPLLAIVVVVIFGSISRLFS